jgi:hypothetical protein
MPAGSNPQPHNPSRAAWRDLLGINASTASLLAAILLVTSATELWSPLVPKVIDRLGGTILLIAAYGTLRDVLETVNYLAGGAIAGRFNTRRALLLFNTLPLVGLLILLTWDSRYAPLAAVPFVFVWDSIAGPATLTVVGQTLAPERRTMAFSLQSIFRRVARVVAYTGSAGALWFAGRVGGVRDPDSATGGALIYGFHIGVLLGIVAIVFALGIQWRYMRTAAVDTGIVVHRPFAVLRSFNPQLKRLLASDILARWAEGIPREFIILHCVAIIGGAVNHAAALYSSVLLNTQAVVNVVLYLLIGPFASRAGLAKKPFIGLTFVFFALFPLALALFGGAFGFIGLILAFIIGGMREVGEPARKAMITELVPPEQRVQAIGIYWGVRSAAVCLAPLVGGALWLVGQRWLGGAGPHLMLFAASAIGLLGAVYFYSRFGRGGGPQKLPMQVG